MKNFKNLSDQELFDIIDSSNITDLKELKKLSKTDSNFRERLLDLKKKNKDLGTENQNEIISLLEQSILTATHEVKPQLEQSLANLKKIFNK